MNRAFFERSSEEVAEELIGCVLVHETPEGTCRGIIVETEAYHEEDPASHTYTGLTARNRAMFGPAGKAYIYFTYGMHYCFNIVTGPDGRGEAVLLRALEPTQGIWLMKKRRGRENLHDLCSGPAKLVQAMGITKEQYGDDLIEGPLRIEDGKSNGTIERKERIGIRKAAEEKLRFCIAGNRFVSKP